MLAENRLPVIQKPKTRNRVNKKLLAFLLLFFITLLCVLFFQSSFSKISSIEIAGQELLTAEAVGQAAGVKPGDHFFSVASEKVEENVKTLRMIESVQVAKHFPGVIHIEVKEYPKVAYQFSEDNKLQVILADGSIFAVSEEANFVLDKPILTGWSSSEQLKIKLCQILQSVPASSLTDISEIKPDPSESYPDKIKIYTRSQFEVVTTVGYLQDKLKYLDSYIANLKENKINTGQLKLLEADTHAPFEQDAQGTKDGAAKGAAGKAAGKDAGADKKTSGTQNNVSPQDAKKEPSKAAGNSSPVKENNTSGKESPRN